MNNLKKYLFAFLLAFIFTSCEKTVPLGPEENEVLDGPMEGLSSAEKIRFIKGDEAFGEVTPLVFLDSPSSTSSLTYKVQVKIRATTLYIGRTVYDTDNDNASRHTSSITVMEIAG